MGHHHPNMWGWRERLGIGCKHRREYTLKVLQGEHWLAILPPIEGGLTERRPPYMETRHRTCHRYLGGLGNINIKVHQKRIANECQPLTSNTAGTSRPPRGLAVRRCRPAVRRRACVEAELACGAGGAGRRAVEAVGATLAGGGWKSELHFLKAYFLTDQNIRWKVSTIMFFLDSKWYIISNIFFMK